MRLYKQSDTSKAVLFLMVDSTDHVTPETGLSPTVTISKNGAAFGAAAGTVAEIANGVYKLTPTAADVGTLGPVLFLASAAGADPCLVEGRIVAFDPYVSTNLGLSGFGAIEDDIAALNDLSSAEVNAACDTAISDAALATAAAVAALNNLSAAQVNAECDTAISDAGIDAAGIVAALKASTGWTEGGSLTLTEALTVVLAMLAGQWQDKTGQSGTYEILDADDGSTVVAEVTPKLTTPQRAVSIQI